uniref:Endothelin-converting protein 8 n=1 Tax=Tityus serrulatus TaxID=6887 RepID=A0A1S5QMY6_TITSE|nr:endothelin-converting protein 8 [Tityus serrulatus]
MKVEKHYFLIRRFLGTSNTWANKKFVILIIILVLLFASSLISLIVIVSHRTEKDENCTSLGCLEAALDLRRGINEFVDPCEDFYEFSCGKFTSSDAQDKIDKIRKDFIEKMKDIIDENWINPNLPDPLEQFFILYNNFISYHYIKENDLHWIEKFIQELGGCSLFDDNWREYNYNWVESYAKATKMAAHMPIFSIFVQPDRRNTKRNIITIKKTLTVRNNEINLQVRNVYLPMLADLSVENFEELIYELDAIDLELLDESASSDLTTNKIETEFMSIEKLQAFIPEVNWERLIQFIFDDIHLPSKAKVTSNTEILIVGKTFLRQFFKKVNKKIISKRQLANYLCITLTEKFAENILISNETGKVITSTTNLIEKLSKTFSYALDYLYYHHIKSHKENFTNDITNYIKEFMSDSLGNTSWLDTETKIVINDKIKKLMITTGFPEFIKSAEAITQYYKDLPSMTSNPYENMINLEKFNYRKTLETLPRQNNREEWGMDIRNSISATGISSNYVPHQNKVVIPQSFQHDSMLNVNYPAYINFARYGFMLAHEIIHSLDTQEVSRSGIGNVMNLWSENSNKEYNKRIQCLIDQYDSYSLLNGVRINNKKAINEIIADNGGLRQAYLAYETYLSKNKGENILMGFENYTPQQMFFLSYASLWCASSDDKLTLDSTTDKHRLNKLSVIGPLINTKEFSEAFKCESIKTMNPNKKCVLW